MLRPFAVLFTACCLFAQTPNAPEAPAKEKSKDAKPPEHHQTAAAPAKKTTNKDYAPSLDVTAMDRSADPCVDFYQYSCGGWMKNNPIPPDQSSWDIYSKLQDETRLQLKQILEDASRPGAQRDAVTQKIGDYYSACMDEAAVEKRGITPLNDQLAAIAALKSPAELAPLLAKLQPANHNMMFDFSSQQDFRDASKQIAGLDQGGLGLPDRDYYLKDDAKSKETRQKYLEHMTKMFTLAGEAEAHATADAATVLRLETEMAKASQSRVDRRNPYNLDHSMTLEQLQAAAPALDWSAFFKTAAAPAFTTVNVASPEFFKSLSGMISSQPLADWQTYLRWHLITSAAPYLSSNFVNENFNFYSKYLRGVEQLPVRWKRCVRYVDRDLGEALGQAYVRKTFSPELKAQTVKMVKEIEAAMESDIKSLPWMSDTTKPEALTKLHSIANKVGYPDKWRDYSALEVRRGDFAGNAQRSAAFEDRRQLNKIGKPLDRGEWGMTPATVNAYYDPQMNDINFPAAILQPPLYDPHSDDAPNYGNTGATIGHELTHGFDDEGRQFDAHGNLRDWWTKEDGQAFTDRAQCVVDQYAQYTIIDDIKINSKLTEGEDVADLGGTILAYAAWKDATSKAKLQNKDGLTPEQRFFVGYGQTWCSNERDENKRERALTDPHSPEKYRANGVVSNMPEFAKAFSCKAGQPMVRQKVCRIW